MLIRDIMTPDVNCVRPDDTLQIAARRMRDLDVGSLPVCGENERLAGMITDRDITVRATSDGRDPTRTAVREVMTPDVVYVYEDQDSHAATEAMSANQIRRILVLDRQKHLTGIVAMADLAVTDGDKINTANTLKDVSEPALPAG